MRRLRILGAASILAVGLVVGLRAGSGTVSASPAGSFIIEATGYYCAGGGTACLDQTNGPLPGLQWVDIFGSGTNLAGTPNHSFIECATYNASGPNVVETLGEVSSHSFSPYNNKITGVGSAPARSDTDSDITSILVFSATGVDLNDANAPTSGSATLVQNTDNTGSQAGSENSGSGSVKVTGKIGTRTYNTSTDHWGAFSYAVGTVSCKFSSPSADAFSPDQGSYGYNLDDPCNAALPLALQQPLYRPNCF